MSIATDTAQLLARTVEVEPGDPAVEIGVLDDDGFSWEHGGGAFVTSGRAARVRASEADDLLRTIAVTDDVEAPGTGAIAVGTLPFTRTADGLLTVPRVVLGRTRDGRGWRTEIARAGTAVADRPPVPAAPGPPWPARVRSTGTREQWDAAVGRALAAIEAGTLEKVVLARTVIAEAAQPIDPLALARFLRKRAPECFVFATRAAVGASPELLVGRLGTEVRVRPLAGSSVGTGAAAIDDLRHSVKDQHEHAIVVAGIRRTLAEACSDVVVGATVTLGLTDLAHLATPIVASAGPATPSALGLALALHPTAAVGGAPTELALAHIAAFEGDRGTYAAPVGWVDARGDGEFAIAIRSTQLGPDRHTAVVRAGAGIVAGSEPEREWRETETKLRTVLRAFTPG